MAEAAIVISSESDAEDLCKGSGKVRNAASEGILSFFSVLPAGKLPHPSHTRCTAPHWATEGHYNEEASRSAKETPPPAESDSDKFTTPRVMIKKLKSRIIRKNK